MQLGYIGLGKMGYNMVERLLEKNHEVVAYDPNPDAVEKVRQRGAEPAVSITEMVEKLKK